MSFKDYYNILGLETNKVTINEIKVAYREQAKKYHPDMNGGDTTLEDKFKDINEAYKTLSDEKARRKYDRNWYVYTERKKKISAKENEEKKSFWQKLMDLLFGVSSTNKKVNPEKKKPLLGENIDTEIEVNILEAFNGTNKKLKLLAVDGKTKTFSLKVPAGVQNGDKIRFVGQGKPGKNGGKNGDLLVKIIIKDTDKFKLKGTDIYTEIELAPWEAALGSKVSVDSIDGNISLVIPKGTQSGELFNIKEKGYKVGMGKRGNFYISTKIVVPKKPTEKEIELYEELKELATNC